MGAKGREKRRWEGLRRREGDGIDGDGSESDGSEGDRSEGKGRTEMGGKETQCLASYRIFYTSL